MTATRLYSAQVLALATRLSAYPLLQGVGILSGAARATTCGSTLSLTLRLSDAGVIAEVGLQAHACAIGQAAAALFADHAAGRSEAELQAATAQITGWLEEAAALPDWPGFSVIAPARDFPARHGAIMLPWKAAATALSSRAVDG